MYRTLIVFHWKTNFRLKIDFSKVEFFGGWEGIDLPDGGMGDLGSYTRVSKTFVFGKTKIFRPGCWIADFSTCRIFDMSLGSWE